MKYCYLCHNPFSLIKGTLVPISRVTMVDDFLLEVIKKYFLITVFLNFLPYSSGALWVKASNPGSNLTTYLNTLQNFKIQ